MLKTSLRSCGDSDADSLPLCLVSPIASVCCRLLGMSLTLLEMGVFCVAFAFCMLSFFSLHFLFGELDLLVAY